MTAERSERGGQRVAAFFDLDNTLMKGASLFVLARHALRSGFYTRSALLRDAFAQMSFRLMGISDEDADKLKDRIGKSVAGKAHADLAALSELIVEDIDERVFPGARERIAWHHDQGHLTFVVSASSAEIVTPVADRLGMDGAIATRPEIDTEGNFTGRILGPWVYGPGKAAAVHALADREGIDLASSWAYSDSASDIPLLELVGHPVAVNPDGRLATRAKEAGWQVMRFERLKRRLGTGTGGLMLVAGGVVALLWLRRARRARSARSEARPSSTAGTPPRRWPRPRTGTSSSGTRPSAPRQRWRRPGLAPVAGQRQGVVRGRRR